MKTHIQTISAQPRRATIGPGLTPWQQIIVFLTKGKIIPT
jgi:hypothetical protein